MRWRFSSILFGTTLAFLGLIGHLYNLQIERGEGFAVRAASQYQASKRTLPRRGIIFFTDKRGERISAVLNKPYTLVYAVPKEIQDAEEAAENLAHILHTDSGALRKKLSKPNDLYEVLAEKVDDATKQKLEALKLKGIYITNQDARFYPFGALAAHLLGFVGPTDSDEEFRGRYGVESRYDLELSGNVGSDGNDIPLTIDRGVQTFAEETLESLVTKFKASGGVVIVEEPQSGKILAMAANPDFDPNTYGSFAVSRFLNPVVEAVYEPGSVFKVLTMASALDAKKITPETTYHDTGFLTLNGKTIRNWDEKAHGRITMTEVIEGSINTGAAFAERALGHEAFLEYLERFGVEEKTGIGLLGEVSGSVKSLKKGARDINFATVSFGQGVSVTPLRLITMVAALANKGVMMQPYLDAREKPREIRRVIGAEAAREVTDMMLSAVEKARVAAIPNYRVAGKTGTAQVPDFVHGGYTHEFIHTYVGFAPAYNPRFIVLIKLDKPQGAPLAGATVVPVFREIAEFLLNYYAVPPDLEPAETTNS